MTKWLWLRTFDKLFRRPARPARRVARRPLGLEALEAREVPAAPPLQFFYSPLPENAMRLSEAALGAAPDNTMVSITSFTASANGTVLYYDQGEDGYEADLANPTQATTQIWGDGNAANGSAPGLPGDIINAGDVVLLRNDVVVNPRDPAVLKFDAGDKVGASQTVAMTRAMWNNAVDTVLAHAAGVFDTRFAGTSFTAPVGTDVATGLQLFEHSSLYVQSTRDNTAVAIDLDGNGTVDVNTTLNEGQTYVSAGTVKAGARVTTDKPVQVFEFTGDIGATYESRTFNVLPDALLSSDYYSPSATTDANHPQQVFVHNPGTTPIVVTVETTAGTSTLSVAAGGTASTGNLPVGSAAHLFTATGAAFTAVVANDVGTDDAGGSTYDWGVTLQATDSLSPVAVVAFAPGDRSLPPTTASSPVWLTVTRDTTVYVDYDGDPTTGSAAGTDPLGNKYDAKYVLSRLTSQRVVDPTDHDQTGMRLYTVDGTDIGVAWGEDPAVAPAGAPGLDMGTTVPAFPTPRFTKTVTLVNDANGDGFMNSGDTVRYTLAIQNRGLYPILNSAVTDALPAQLLYVPGSTRANGTPVADDAAGTAFPLDGGGFTVPTVGVGNTTLVTFDAVIDTGLTPATVVLTNTGSLSYGITLLRNSVTSTARGAVGDTVYADADGDGAQDNGEAGIGNVTLSLYRDANGNGSLDGGDTFVTTKTTDGTGFYVFGDLDAGRYLVDVTDANHVLTGWTLTSGVEPRAATVAPGEAVQGIDFGYRFNLLPVAVNDATTTKENAPVTLTAAALLTNDNPGDAPASVTAVSPVSTRGGTVTLGAGGATYTPPLNFNGTDTFTYTITDNNGDTSTATVTVTVDALPLAVNDALGTKEDAPATITRAALLSNDDQGTAPATVTAVSPTSARGGTVTLGAAGATYTPPLNFNGTDTFTYTITDRNGDTSTATVTVTVNAVPNAVNDTVAAKEDTPITVTLATLLTNDDQGDAPATVTAVSPTSAQGGTVVLGAGGVTYTPPANFNGTDTFTYTIADADGDTSTATVTMNVNAVPDAVDDLLDAEEDARLVIAAGTLLTNDDLGNTPTTVTAVSATSTRGGTVTLVAGVVTYTPPANFNGTDTFTYTIADIDGDTSTATVTLTVAPTPDAVDDTAGTLEGSPVTTGNVLTNDDLGTAPAAVTGYQTVGASGGTVVYNGNGTFTYTPPPGFSGVDLFTYTITDANGNTSTATVRVTVTPLPRAGSVGDRVWLDFNADGVQDADEPGLTGVVVTLTWAGPDDDFATPRDNATFTATTGANGSFTIPGLPDGQYRAAVTGGLPAGAAATFDLDGGGDASTVFTLAGGAARTDIDFGFRGSSSLAGRVFRDYQVNGTFEPNAPFPETGIAGVGVTLTGTDVAGNAITRAATTDASGTYTFGGLLAGTYTLAEGPLASFTAPGGFYDGVDSAGPAGGTVGNDVVRGIALGTNAAGTGYGFGENPPADPFGFVYLDRNHNGTRDAGEPGIPGVSVTVAGTAFAGTALAHTLTAADVPGGLTAITDADGRWEFAIIPPGVYSLTETQPTGVADGPEENADPNGPFTVVVGNDTFTNVELSPFPVRGPFNFGEWPLAGPGGTTLPPLTGTTPPAPTDPSKRGFLGSTASGPELPPLPTAGLDPTFGAFNPSAVRAPAFVSVADDAGAGWVRVFDFAAGVERFRFQPFGDFAGGVRVATGDVTGDGIPDIVTAAGAGGGPVVKVYDGATGTEIASTMAFDPAFRGGVQVAVADFTGDGVAEVIVTPDGGGGPVVRVLDGRTLATRANFFALDPDFRGGLRVAAGDVNRDGTPDLVVTAGTGGGPRVAGYDGTTLFSGSPQRLFGDFFGFAADLRSGQWLTVSDANGDGFADVILGAGEGGGPRVVVYSGQALATGSGPQAVGSFLAGDADSRGGARVASADLDGDGRAELLAAGGAGVRPVVYVYDAATGTRRDAFLGLLPEYMDGLMIG